VTLVGGGAVEFYASEVYVTYDIGLVVGADSGVLYTAALNTVFVAALPRYGKSRLAKRRTDGSQELGSQRA
jgi:hypothetical protein